MKNSEIIDHPNYYKLPCNKDLEDFIFEKGLTFAEGCALKYLWRAGKKDGEAREKDMAKFRHYCDYLKEHYYFYKVDQYSPSTYISFLRDEAMTWDGTGCE